MAEEQGAVPLERRHPPIPWVAKRFQLNLDVLREMLSDTGPALRAVDEKVLGPDALARLDLLEEPQRETLRAVLEKAQRRAAEEFDRLREAGEELPDGVELLETEAKELVAVFAGDNFAFSRFMGRMHDAAAGPSRSLIFRNSLLTMAIGAFEVLIAGIVAQYYVAHPEALGDEKAFSLSDLRDFGDLDDAADHLLAKRVADLMYGGFRDWSQWFEKTCDARLGEYAMDFDAVNEAFQRRHLVIHNGGLVSGQYLTQVKIDGDAPEVGTRLDVTDEYLTEVFDQLDVLGTALASFAWGTWSPDQRDSSAAAILMRSYELMLTGRWEAVRHLTDLGKKMKAIGAIEHALSCNHWLSRLETDGLASIKPEVEDWDTSALAGRFKLVQLVLLDQLDEALASVPDLVKRGEVSWGELREWPILARLRAHPKFEQVAQSVAPAKVAEELDDRPGENGSQAHGGE